RTSSSWEDAAPERRKSVLASIPQVSHYDSPAPVSHVSNGYDPTIDVHKESKISKITKYFCFSYYHPPYLTRFRFLHLKKKDSKKDLDDTEPQREYMYAHA